MIRTCKPNKPFPFQVAFGYSVLCRNINQTRPARDRVFVTKILKCSLAGRGKQLDQETFQSLEPRPSLDLGFPSIQCRDGIPGSQEVQLWAVGGGGGRGSTTSSSSLLTWCGGDGSPWARLVLHAYPWLISSRGCDVKVGKSCVPSEVRLNQGSHLQPPQKRGP